MNIKSSFPTSVDNLIFYQDITLDNKVEYDTYLKLLSEKKYVESSQYIKDNDMLFYGADMFNLLEDMIYQLQDYLIKNPKEPKFFYSDEEPIELNDGCFWI